VQTRGQLRDKGHFPNCKHHREYADERATLVCLSVQSECGTVAGRAQRKKLNKWGVERGQMRRPMTAIFLKGFLVDPSLVFCVLSFFLFEVFNVFFILRKNEASQKLFKVLWFICSKVLYRAFDIFVACLGVKYKHTDTVDIFYKTENSKENWERE